MKYAEDKKFEYMVKMAMLDCGAKDAAFFDSIDTSDVVISRRLKNKIARTIRKAHNERFRIPVKRVGLKVLLVALITMSLMFMISMTIPQVREAVWDAIVDWYEDYLVIRYEPEDAESGIAPPKTIEVVHKPSYVPEGAVENERISRSYAWIKYYIEETHICSYRQTIMNNKPYYYDNQTVNIWETAIQGNPGYIVQYVNSTNLIITWDDGEYVYILESTQFSIEELLKMAESVQ